MPLTAGGPALAGRRAGGRGTFLPRPTVRPGALVRAEGGKGEGGGAGGGRQPEVAVSAVRKVKSFNLFTKKNELFIGQLATMGFAASLLGERLTGKGIVGQLNIETGLPIYDLEPALAFFVAFLLVAALLPGSGTFKEEEADSVRLARGGGTVWYSVAKELVLDRVTMLLFAASIILEHVTGQGPLALMGIPTNVDLDALEVAGVFVVLLLTQQGATGTFEDDNNSEDDREDGVFRK